MEMNITDGGWNFWVGKKVWINLRNSRYYTGKVIEISNNFLTLIDKFQIRVSLLISEILEIKENKNGN